MPVKELLDKVNEIYRHRLIAACILAVGIVLTLWTNLTLPDVYQSTTLIMVEAQDVPSSYVQSTVTSRVEERLNALNQEVLSRTRLSAIIDDFDLFHDQRAQGVPREAIVGIMRNTIQIQVFPKDNAFRITHEGSDPVVVRRVTARLAGLYIDENLRMREEHASGTTDFLENELEKARRQLEEHELLIKAFKQEHIGELPEQREASMRALSGLQTQLQTISMALSSARERQLIISRQIADTQAAAPLAASGAGRAPDDPRSKLQALEAELGLLQARYTEEHPDVIRARREIDRLRGQSAAAGSVASAPLASRELTQSSVEVRLEIARLKAEQADIEKSIGQYQTRLENGFAREQEMLSLNRDYEVTTKRYQALLGKKLEAQLAQSLETRQKAERFRILDPASLAEKPYKPNRQLLLLGGFGASIALAALLPILFHAMNLSYRSAEELAECGIPVLAIISEIETRDTKRRRRQYRLRVLGASAAALLVGLTLVSFYARALF